MVHGLNRSKKLDNITIVINSLGIDKILKESDLRKLRTFFAINSLSNKK